MISALTGTVTHGSNDWLIDNGASKHMTGFKEYFVRLSEHESPHKVKLGEDYQYPIKGSGESFYKLDSGKSIKMKDVLFVPGLKNVLSIFAEGFPEMQAKHEGVCKGCAKGNLYEKDISK